MAMRFRIEHDMLGERKVPADAYWGIHTLRAAENFPVSGQPVHPELIRALVQVKKAAAWVNRDLGLLPEPVAEAILGACDDILDGTGMGSPSCHGNMQDAGNGKGSGNGMDAGNGLDAGNSMDAGNGMDTGNDISGRLPVIAGGWLSQFPVDAMQGGAGTSTNMNVNEVLANRAIERMGGTKGDYGLVHPLDHVNMSQSTNDVFPTAFRVAAIRLLLPLSESFAALQTALQEKENEYGDILKVGRTQLQDAVPMLLGQEFGAWAQAVARDRWRLYKAEERLRQVNLGGTAIGTGLNAEKQYVFQAVERLRELTGLGLARADSMVDPTQNCDVFVEVSGLLKTAAVNLTKISNDLRLLASGPRAGIGEIRLPAVQAGSSIMPGKVNPVIPEMVNQVAFQVIGDDLAITMAAGAGQLELNAFLPVMARNLFEMMTLMTGAVRLLIDRCIKGITPDRERCMELVEGSNALVTALSTRIGYDEASDVAKTAAIHKRTVREELTARIDLGILADADGTAFTHEMLAQALNPLAMTKPGIPGRKPIRRKTAK
jgi:aspartate ammonia-lyase